LSELALVAYGVFPPFKMKTRTSTKFKKKMQEIGKKKVLLKKPKQAHACLTA